MTHEVTREDLLARVQHLTPVIQEHADRAEQERHLADPVVAALQDAGLYRMLVPHALGGLQVDPLTFYQVVEALAHIDGATGWCMFINGSAPLSIGFLQDEAAEAMCGNGTRMIQSATIFPFGRAVPHKGGYLVSGHWVYASGCWHSTWHMVACNVYEDAAIEPRSGPTGMPELIMAHLPRTQVQVLDTWQVSGLSATGSHDVEVQDVFVPEAFVWKFTPQAAHGRHFGGPLYRFPFMPSWAFSVGPLVPSPWGSRRGPSTKL